MAHVKRVAAAANGVAVLGTYVGQVRFVLPPGVSGGSIYPRASREVWDAVQKVLRKQRKSAET